MSTKPIKPDLLWQVIVWVQSEYASLPEAEQQKRPQRPWRQDDGKIISPLIKAVRAAYHADKLARGKLAQFDACKKSVLNKAQQENFWDDATRNFYSSVVATYITWDYQTIPASAKPLLARIVPLASYLRTS